MNTTKHSIYLAVLYLLFPTCLFAQQLNMASSSFLDDKHLYNFQFNSNYQYKYVTYRVSVPSSTFAIIGVKRIEGTGDADAAIVRNVYANSYEQANLSGIITKSINPGNKPELLIVGPESTAQSYYLYLQQYDNNPGKWEISLEFFDFWKELGSAFATSTAQYFLECLLTTCSDAAPSPNEQAAGRALGLAFAALQSNSICSLGVRAFANEVQAKFTEEYPGSQFLATVVNNFLTSFGGKVADVTC